MEKRRSGKKIAPRVTAARTALFYGLLGIAACTGVEGDVLSLRSFPDLAVAAEAGTRVVDGGTPGCTTQTLSISGCVDVMAWLPKAAVVCSSLGLMVGRVLVTEPCSMSASQGVSFECCPAPVCTPQVLGDAMSCRDSAVLLESAEHDCQTRGAQANWMVLVDSCAAHRFRMVKYMCCTGLPAPPPLPPPPPLLMPMPMPTVP